MPDTVTAVSEFFLSECPEVETIDLSNTIINTIGSHFAYKCDSLSSVKLPDTVTAVAGTFLAEAECPKASDSQVPPGAGTGVGM